MGSRPDDSVAPEGQIWACGACGKVARDRYAFNDASCFIWACLVFEASAVFDELGRITKAEGIRLNPRS